METTHLKNPENIAGEYLELKNQKLLIDKRLDELKPILETYLQGQPERSAEMVNHLFKLTDSEREFFDLKKAKEKLDGRVLKPYIKMSKFLQIRVTFKGEEGSK